jgi:hypothetical protein
MENSHRRLFKACQPVEGGWPSFTHGNLDCLSDAACYDRVETLIRRDTLSVKLVATG